MTALPRPTRASADGGLRWLADAYARYAHLVHDQLQALDQGDLDRVASLATEREALASQIDGRDANGDAGIAGADRLADEARANLQRAADADRTLRRRLRELRGEVQEAVRMSELTTEKAITAARSYAATAQAGTRLDVSF